MIAARHRRARGEVWRLALNLTSICFVGGVLFVVVGSWAAAWSTFGVGVACAAAAGFLVRRAGR